jgi:hypothetical protein
MTTELSDRSLGWLRYLHRKAHTPDDWNREGRPHPHWDDRSDPPMASWPRFDLTDSSYAISRMAQTTPAWRRKSEAGVLLPTMARAQSWPLGVEKGYRRLGIWRLAAHARGSPSGWV